MTPTKEETNQKEFSKDNINWLETLTYWCIEHKVQFSGKETSVIMSTIDEIITKFKPQEPSLPKALEDMFDENYPMGESVLQMGISDMKRKIFKDGFMAGQASKEHEKMELIEKLMPPTDKETEEWFELWIGTGCSASSGIYKFRNWLKERYNKVIPPTNS